MPIGVYVSVPYKWLISLKLARFVQGGKKFFMGWECHHSLALCPSLMTEARQNGKGATPQALYRCLNGH